MFKGEIRHSAQSTWIKLICKGTSPMAYRKKYSNYFHRWQWNPTESFLQSYSMLALNSRATQRWSWVTSCSAECLTPTSPTPSSWAQPSTCWWDLPKCIVLKIFSPKWRNAMSRRMAWWSMVSISTNNRPDVSSSSNIFGSIAFPSTKRSPCQWSVLVHSWAWFPRVGVSSVRFLFVPERVFEWKQHWSACGYDSFSNHISSANCWLIFEQGKAGAIDESTKIFQSIHQRDVVLHNAMSNYWHSSHSQIQLPLSSRCLCEEWEGCRSGRDLQQHPRTFPWCRFSWLCLKCLFSRGFDRRSQKYFRPDRDENQNHLHDHGSRSSQSCLSMSGAEWFRLIVLPECVCLMKHRPCSIDTRRRTHLHWSCTVSCSFRHNIALSVAWSVSPSSGSAFRCSKPPTIDSIERSLYSDEIPLSLSQIRSDLCIDSSREHLCIGWRLSASKRCSSPSAETLRREDSTRGGVDWGQRTTFRKSVLIS